MSIAVPRRALLIGGTMAGLGAGRTRARSLDKLSVQLAWRAQAQHGALYQAVATGLYRDAGLEIEIRAGGPQLDANRLLLAGRVDFIESNGLGALAYAVQDLPGVAVAALFQKDERVLLAHRGMGNDSLPELKGKPILVSSQGRLSFWPWLKARYGYSDAQARPYTGSLAPFLADRTLCQQGFLTTEPFALRAAGVDPVVLLLADAGFDNYQGLLMCAPRLAADKSELVQRFVDATLAGWASYLGGDPAPGNGLIRRDNPDMSEERLAHAIATIRAHRLADGESRLGLGAMTRERWRSFYRDMSEAGALPAGLAIERVFTLQFLNRAMDAPRHGR